MTRLTSCVLLGVLCAAAGFSCDNSADSASNSAKPDASNEPTVSLRFDDDGSLVLLPRTSVTIHATVDPAEPVRFLLLGDSLDSSLSNDAPLPNTDGSVSTRLYASTKPSTFRLRFSAENTAIERKVVVTEAAYALAHLAVTPAYSGKRPTANWTVSLYPGDRCDSIARDAPDSSTSATSSNVPIRLNAPSGVSVATVVHAEGRVRGCADLPSLDPGDSKDVTVSVLDIPATVAGAQLFMAMSIDGTADGWAELVERWASTYFSALLQGEQDSTTLLLNSISAGLSPSDKLKFNNARMTRGWDSIVAQHLGDTDLVSVLQGWTQTASGQLSTGPGEFSLSAQADSTGENVSMALSSAFGSSLEPSQVIAGTGTLLVDAADTAFASSAALTFTPNQVLGPRTESVAVSSVLGAQNVADSLDAYAKCSEISALLVQPNGVVFGSCDDTCFVVACRAGLTNIFDRARLGAADHNSPRLAFSATGSAVLDTSAVLLGFTGTFVGTVIDPKAGPTGTTLALTGNASATSIVP